MTIPFADFTKRQLRTLRFLDSPEKVQEFVEKLAYNLEEDGETAHSPLKVMEYGKAHCLEAAVFAAFAFFFHNRPPLLMDLRAVRDEDHVLCLFRMYGRWGSVAKSKFTGLRSRDPVYKNLRELALSYFEDFYNLAGEKTLREYSRPLDLRRFDERDWMTCKGGMWFIPQALENIRHYKLLGPMGEKTLRRIKGDPFKGGLVGYPREDKIRHLVQLKPFRRE